MNQVLIDNTILAVSLLSAIVISRFLKDRKTGFIFSIFLLFPPLVTFSNMWAHTFAVSIVNVKRYLAGGLQYSFALYSLLLFGIVFIVVSGLALHCSRKYLSGDKRQKRNIYLLNIFTACAFLPVVPLNPIAALPVIAAIISSFVLRIYDPYKTTTVYRKRDEYARALVS
jgi:hypothetical protein